ncbi:DNA polymerase III subunit beta [Vibrio nigripulchritudo SO65]|uniref:DNA polymerase III subunit beta n=1 Tax=Vibrio nigripulchritudo TaxID=28173 RepID=UPI0003B230C2|nr:DNA polymerase III subunit beta [Vibrio nigripulchritudo]CCN33361.1 DNA polymerase III subunit beta [Vibrio nigripulchritudo AM115]CCN42901.1 DNA polymerase III subunit beta [Vibrio nigripulchritudo FTn2]CCN65456.1 DNA polymerase III subunit beta [Vibrio nigripulchritudo POn4]CCN73786.1 DNA polymerase III subunit beta [Vibrio nigripulchritudo SFn118]CCN79521.1 DNA polymerase III subunit beta [Vibrio nigripulchritudo SO65]
MKFTIERSHLIKPLQQVSGALGGRPTLPILGNLLLKVENGQLAMTATDLEVELVANVALEGEFEAGSTTVPSRKFLDICRGLPDNAIITVVMEADRVQVRSGRSRFSLSTLPASDFPNIEDWQSEADITLSQQELRSLIEKTQFSMANQDVRYYLNGMLFEIEGTTLRSVATDGHRMAVSQTQLASELPNQQIILPRKGVQELVKLLDAPEAEVTLQIGSANLRAAVNNFTFTSKLVDGRFPDYRRVMPQSSNKTLEAPCEELKSAFSRAAILSNEKFRGVRVNFNGNEMRITANNPEQEEAEEMLDVSFQGDDLEIGFNVSYVLDVLNTLRCEQVRISMSDANASALIENAEDDSAMYVVMPIRL